MKTHIHELVEAAEAIERVLVDLDQTAHVCDSCGTRRATNWSETKWARGLEGAKNRVDQIITEMSEKVPKEHSA